jgi:hypothetical protein
VDRRRVASGVGVMAISVAQASTRSAVPTQGSMLFIGAFVRRRSDAAKGSIRRPILSYGLATYSPSLRLAPGRDHMPNRTCWMMPAEKWESIADSSPRVKYK